MGISDWEDILKSCLVFKSGPKETKALFKKENF